MELPHCMNENIQYLFYATQLYVCLDPQDLASRSAISKLSSQVSQAKKTLRNL
jgi:hypothetical protein